MNYERIGTLLTFATAITGVLVAFTETPVIALIIIAIASGLWWNYGRSFMGTTTAPQQPTSSK